MHITKTLGCKTLGPTIDSSEPVDDGEPSGEILQLKATPFDNIAAPPASFFDLTGCDDSDTHAPEPEQGNVIEVSPSAGGYTPIIFPAPTINPGDTIFFTPGVYTFNATHTPPTADLLYKAAPGTVTITGDQIVANDKFTTWGIGFGTDADLILNGDDSAVLNCEMPADTFVSIRADNVEVACNRMSNGSRITIPGSGFRQNAHIHHNEIVDSSINGILMDSTSITFDCGSTTTPGQGDANHLVEYNRIINPALECVSQKCNGALVRFNYMESANFSTIDVRFGERNVSYANWMVGSTTSFLRFGGANNIAVWNYGHGPAGTAVRLFNQVCESTDPLNVGDQTTPGDSNFISCNFFDGATTFLTTLTQVPSSVFTRGPVGNQIIDNWFRGLSGPLGQASYQALEDSQLPWSDFDTNNTWEPNLEFVDGGNDCIDDVEPIKDSVTVNGVTYPRPDFFDGILSNVSVAVSQAAFQLAQQKKKQQIIAEQNFKLNDG